MGVKETPAAPTTQAQPQPLAVASGGGGVSAQPISTSTQAGGNPYMRGSGVSTATTNIPGGSNVSGYYAPTIPGSGQTGSAGYGGYAPITQPFPGQPAPISTTGPAVIQPSYVTGGGAPMPGQPTGRNNTFAVDEPMTWNDPPTLKSKKVLYLYHNC